MDDTRMVSQLPPLEPGETEVAAFASQAGGPSPAPAPASLLSAKSEIHSRVSTLRVNVTTMEKNHSVQRGQVDLKLALLDAKAATGDTWTKSIRRYDGQLREHSASCQDGKFQCSGDAAWCMDQKKIVCQEVVMDEQDEEEAAKIALQPTESLEIADHADSQPEHHDLVFMQRRSRLQGMMN
jgi:hypothetical protein